MLDEINASKKHWYKSEYLQFPVPAFSEWGLSANYSMPAFSEYLQIPVSAFSKYLQIPVSSFSEYLQVQ